MIFGPVPVAEAQGATLAHSLPVQTGRLAKGTVLQAAEVAALAAAGHDTVVVARLEAQDVEENAAAAALAQALVPDPAGQILRVRAAGAGRVNLFATRAGVFVPDTEAVAALNGIDPMITLATLPAFQRVTEGAMVGTVKVISYAVEQAHLEAACRAGAAAVRVAPPCLGSATLIETQVAAVDPSDKGRAAMAARLARLEVMLGPRVLVPHAEAPLAQAIAAAPGEIVLILMASATSDPRDTAPQALRAAGGTVTAYGMPVDPGNLLFFGQHRDRPVIGLPGCARSLALNGADWVLERLVCGLPLGQADIAAMGVGGLLKEIPTRPRPRTGAGAA